MKEHPILFSDVMVRAILDGRKTQTRRPVKPPMGEGSPPECHWLDCGVEPDTQRYGIRGPLGIHVSPFGGPGSTLWVRECWATDLHYEQDAPSKIAAKAAEAGYPPSDKYPACGVFYRSDGAYRQWGDYVDVQGKWRPSIHMPRWASRITLTVTGVWVERVQDISNHDIVAEGIAPLGPEHNPGVLQKDFRRLWDSIYADKGFGWDENPWVWVGEFGQEERSTAGRLRSLSPEDTPQSVRDALAAAVEAFPIEPYPEEDRAKERQRQLGGHGE